MYSTAPPAGARPEITRETTAAASLSHCGFDPARQPPQPVFLTAASILFSVHQTQDAFQKGCGMRGTTGNIQIRLKDLFHSAATLGGVRINTAGYGTASAGDHPNRARYSVISFLQSQQHILAYRSCNKDAVGMPGRCDDLNPETPHIPRQRPQDIKVQLTSGTAAGGHLTDLEGFTAEPQELAIRWTLRLVNASGSHQGSPGHCRQPVFRSQLQSSCGASIFTIPAEDTFSGIDRDLSIGLGNCVDGTGSGTCSASRAGGLLPLRTAGKTVRQIRGGFRKRPSAVSLKQTRFKCFQHRSIFLSDQRSCPQ